MARQPEKDKDLDNFEKIVVISIAVIVFIGLWSNVLF